jgi:hypothetical protein
MASHVHCHIVSPRGTQPQDELFPYIADEHPNILSTLSQSQPSQRLSHDGDRPSRTNLRVFYDGDRPSRTNLQDALSTTMSGLPTLTNAPASMVTRHGFSVSDQSVLGPGPGTCSHAPPASHTALILLSSWTSTSLLLAGTRVPKLVEMSDNELQCFLLPSRIPLLTPICNVLGVLYSRRNFIALQKSIHYS